MTYQTLRDLMKQDEIVKQVEKLMGHSHETEARLNGHDRAAKNLRVKVEMVEHAGEAKQEAYQIIHTNHGSRLRAVELLSWVCAVGVVGLYVPYALRVFGVIQ